MTAPLTLCTQRELGTFFFFFFFITAFSSTRTASACKRCPQRFDPSSSETAPGSYRLKTEKKRNKSCDDSTFYLIMCVFPSSEKNSVAILRSTCVCVCVWPERYRELQLFDTRATTLPRSSTASPEVCTCWGSCAALVQ